MKSLFRGVLLILALSLTTSSCIGSFGLFKKLKSWNSEIGTKFVNELVFVAFWIVPVYEVAFLADILVLNSIEFWSGNNPVQSGKKIVEGKDGKYLLEWDKSGYKITSMQDGTIVYLDFDSDENSWSLRGHNGKEYKLMTFIDDAHVVIPSYDGERRVFELGKDCYMAAE